MRAAGDFVLAMVGVSSAREGGGATSEVGAGVGVVVGAELEASEGTGLAAGADVGLEAFFRVALGLNSAVGAVLFFLALGAGRLDMGPESGEEMEGLMEDLMGAVSFGGVGLTFTVVAGFVALEAWGGTLERPGLL